MGSHARRPGSAPAARVRRRDRCERMGDPSEPTTALIHIIVPARKLRAICVPRYDSAAILHAGVRECLVAAPYFRSASQP
jgi:hypothetical protein